MGLSAARPDTLPRPGYSAAFLLLPILTSVRLSPAIQLACMGALLILCLIGKPHATRLGQYLPITLFGLCAVMSLARGGTPADWVSLILATVAVILAGRRSDPSTAIRSLVAGLAIYLLVNIAGWLVGIQSPAATVRVGLLEDANSLLGVRVLFPFARSINEPPIVAAAFIAFALVSMRMGRDAPRWYWAGILMSLFVISASSSRFPAIVLLAILAGTLLWPRAARLVPSMSLAFVAMPFVFDALTTPLLWVSDRLVAVTFFARGQSAAEIAGGSSRAAFWESGLAFWERSPDWSERLFGYGYNGHVESHVVFTYYQSSPEFFLSTPAALTLHNSYLQQMFDTGYVGLASLVAALWLVGRRFAKKGDWATCAMFGVLVATSAVEVYLVPTFLTAPSLLIMALSCMAPSRATGTGTPPLPATPWSIDHNKDVEPYHPV